MVETYEKLWSSREEAERKQTLLSDQYSALALQYPEKRIELVEQATKDKAAIAAITTRAQQSGIGG